MDKDQRFLFIDHFRAWAIVFMIETHAFNLWLLDTERQGPWYPFLRLINGLVAPSFLFLAGVSFMIVASRKFDALSHGGREFFRQLGKYLWIWLIGYALHLPAVRFRGWTPFIPMKNIQGFASIDILHTIAFGLIVLLVLCLILRSIGQVHRVAVILVALVTLATPFLWRIDFSNYVPLEIANYINGLHNPRFPLFPWIAFLFAGAVAGGFFIQFVQGTRETEQTNLMILCGLIVFAIGYFGRPYVVLPYTKFWLDSPQWILMRMGVVVVLFCAFRKLENIQLNGSPILRILGKESLLIYVYHLVVIYWITGPKSRFPLLQYRAYTLSQATFLFLLLMMSAILVAWVKRAIQKARRAKLPQGPQSLQPSHLS